MIPKLRRKILVLVITILVMHAVFMSISMVYAETTFVAAEQENLVLLPGENYFKEKQTDKSHFFFTHSKMQGTVDKPLQVTFFSDQEVSEVRVSLPKEATIRKEQLPKRISVEEGEQPTEWIIQSKGTQNTFVLPLVFDTVGVYELSVEKNTAQIEIKEQDALIEHGLSSEEQLQEQILDKFDSNKSTHNNSISSVDQRNIVNVSTENQFINAFNNLSVSKIILENNIYLNESLNILTRDVEISGNGFQLFTGNQVILLGDNSVLSLTNLELLANQPPSATVIQIRGSNAQIILNNFDYRNDTVVLANIVSTNQLQPSYSVIFDGGITNLTRLSSGSAQSIARILVNIQAIEMLNNSVLNLTNANISFSGTNMASFNISEGSVFNISNSLLLNSPILNLDTLNVEGKANMSINNASLGGIENVKIGSTGEFSLNSDWNSGTIDSSIKNIEIIKGSVFDINNSSGASITNGEIKISIDSTILALWELGLQREEKASKVFYDFEANLYGINASIVGTTSNERFQRLYDSSGMSAYSRISNRDIGEMDRFVTVRYESEDGVILEDPELLTGLLGDIYQSKRKEIQGYQLMALPKNESGEFTREMIEVIYVYKQISIPPVDPLDPEIEMDPENKPELPEDQKLLSIDFVSSFNFGSQAISAQDQTYYAQPQRLLNEDGTVNSNEERPNYVQISDRRPENERRGWQLAVTQRGQFEGGDDQELMGARLRLMNQQVVSAQNGAEPHLQQTNPLTLVPNAKRILLLAQGDEGAGTWVYRFGDSDTAGQSIALDVPKGATPEATRYTTTLLWELSAVPEN